ncbi:hypothetical protein NF212_17460 [Parasalinivibrio latis]
MKSFSTVINLMFLLLCLYAIAGFFGLAPLPFVASGCKTSESDIAVSPDGKWEAFQTAKSCKNRPQEVQVWLSARHQADRTEQIFYAIYPSDKALAVQWSGTSNLVLSFPDSVRPTTKPGNFKGVDVNYRHSL